MWSNLLLDLLVARWDTFKGSYSQQCLPAPTGFVWQHTTNCTLEDFRRSTVVKWSSCRIHITSLTKETKKLQLVPNKNATWLTLVSSNIQNCQYKIVIFECKNLSLNVPEKCSRNLHLFASYNTDFMSIKSCFGDHSRQSAHKMLSGIDDNWL